MLKFTVAQNVNLTSYSFLLQGECVDFLVNHSSNNAKSPNATSPFEEFWQCVFTKTLIHIKTEDSFVRKEIVSKRILCSGEESWVCQEELKRWVVSAGTWLDVFCWAGLFVTSVSGKESSLQERWTSKNVCPTTLRSLNNSCLKTTVTQRSLRA